MMATTRKRSKIYVDDSIEDTSYGDECNKVSTGNSGENIFDEQWNRVAAIRLMIQAPVDTMGCHRLAKDGAMNEDRKFQILVTAMLSSLTKDQNTRRAMEMLHDKFGGHGGFSCYSISSASLEAVKQCIKTVGMYGSKAKNLLLAAIEIKEKYMGRVPSEFRELISMRGVGPKMAYLVISHAHGIKDAGICVDTHVHRLSRMLGWVPICKGSKNNPENTRVELQRKIPQNLWADVNLLLVGIGQMIQQNSYGLVEGVISHSEDDLESLILLKTMGLDFFSIRDKTSGNNVLHLAIFLGASGRIIEYLRIQTKNQSSIPKSKNLEYFKNNEGKSFIDLYEGNTQ